MAGLACFTHCRMLMASDEHVLVVSPQVTPQIVARMNELNSYIESKYIAGGLEYQSEWHEVST